MSAPRRAYSILLPPLPRAFRVHAVSAPRAVLAKETDRVVAEGAEGYLLLAGGAGAEDTTGGRGGGDLIEKDGL